MYTIGLLIVCQVTCYYSFDGEIKMAAAYNCSFLPSSTQSSLVTDISNIGTYQHTPNK